MFQDNMINIRFVLICWNFQSNDGFNFYKLDAQKFVINMLVENNYTPFIASSGMALDPHSFQNWKKNFILWIK